MNNIKEKFSGEYSKLQNNNDSDKFLNDDDIVLEDSNKIKPNNNNKDSKKSESEYQNSNLIEVLDQDDKTKLIKEDRHKKIPENDSNVEVLNIENAMHPYASAGEAQNPNLNNNTGDIFEKSIAEFNKEITENIEKNPSSSSSIPQTNQIENQNIHLNEMLKDQNAFLAYNENGDLIILEKNSNLIDLQAKAQDLEAVEEPFEIEIDEFDENNIANNNSNNSYKDGFYNASNSSLNNSGNRVGFFKRSSMTVSDLTDDSKLRKSISLWDEADKKDYIEVADWDFEKEENKDRFENKFKEFEKKFFTINKRADLYTLYEKIKSCNLYFNDPKGDYIPNIGLVSTLEYMIESTFGFDPNKSPEIITHFKALDKQIFRWRSIIGDGNCFYRGVIFSFLEKAVFDKNVFLIKKIILDIDKIINVENEILKYLSLEIQNEILIVNKNLVLKILYLLYEITEQNSNDGVQTCYEFLIKCFNFCKHFDQAMTFYLRYLLFDFIRVNKGKLFSKNFAINIGNLLPADYETSSGDFLYDRFFNENLMKFGTDAEKIVIYLTPFVLKTNIKIIIYEFDSPDAFLLAKEFPCYLEDKHEIVVLYRKTHYDIAYVDKYFEKYTKHLSSFVNLEENLRILTFDLLEKIRNSSNPDFNINENLLSKKHYNIADNPNNNEANSQEIKLHSDLANLNIASNVSAREESRISKCLNCNSDYIHKENVFGFCNICIRNELISNIMATYLIFSTEAVQLYSHGKEAQIPELLRTILTQKFITVRNYNITISKLASIGDMNIESLIKDVKANICALCQRNVNKEFSFKLPCGCNLCDKNCAINCFKLFFNKEKDFKDDCFCLCGSVFNTNDFKMIFELLVNLNMKDQMKYLQKFVAESFMKSCFFCLEKTEYDFNLAVVKDPLMTNLYKVKEFKHVICNDCIRNNKIKEKSKIECLICNSSHQITKIKKNIGDIDDNCSIL